MRRNNQPTNSRHPSSDLGTPAQEGEMVTHAYEADLADEKKLLQAPIHIPELGLTGKFVNGIFENSLNSKDKFAVEYHKHGDHFTFYLPGEMLDVSKSESPTTTYIVLFNSELTDIIASKKLLTHQI